MEHFNHMMKRLLTISLIPLIFLSGSSLNASNIIKVKEIEFKGLKNLSKYDIIKKVKTRAVEDGIVVDVDDLNERLKKNLLIVSHRVTVADDRMIVSIVEKNLFIPVLITDGRQSQLYEMDDEFNLFSKKRIYTGNAPVLVIKKNMISSKRMSENIRNLVILINRVKYNNRKLYREISEVIALGSSSADVILKGRKTRFRIKTEYQGFSIIDYVAGYLDRINYYPDSISVYGNVAFVKPDHKNR